MVETCSFVQTDSETPIKLTFEQRPEGNEEGNYANIWCKSLSHAQEISVGVPG